MEPIIDPRLKNDPIYKVGVCEENSPIEIIHMVIGTLNRLVEVAKNEDEQNSKYEYQLVLRIKELQNENAKLKLASGYFMGRPADYWAHLEEYSKGRGFDKQYFRLSELETLLLIELNRNKSNEKRIAELEEQLGRKTAEATTFYEECLKLRTHWTPPKQDEP